MVARSGLRVGQTMGASQDRASLIINLRKRLFQDFKYHYPDKIVYISDRCRNVCQKAGIVRKYCQKNSTIIPH